MYPILYNIKDIGSILCTGMVIKMLDDMMDNDCHYLKYLLKKHDKQTIYNTLLGYMLLLLCLGSILNYIYSSTLFVSAYVIGMFFDINMKMPSGLRVYQECIIYGAILFLIFSWQQVVSSFLIVWAIQLLDDILDHKKDKKLGIKNYVNRFGLVETILFCLMLLLCSYGLNWEKSLSVTLISLFIIMIFNYLDHIFYERIKKQ